MIEKSDFSEFPPRLPEQPIFYPVLNKEYACQIARDWNVRDSGVGYVTRFEVSSAYLEQFPRRIVGSSTHEELWIPAEKLDEFNNNIIGQIEVIETFSGRAL